tara:strand:+ start:419 stop:571 length:153 start_codon:yes stop_codon:yes gene_type:complete
MIGLKVEHLWLVVMKGKQEEDFYLSGSNAKQAGYTQGISVGHPFDTRPKR